VVHFRLELTSFKLNYLLCYDLAMRKHRISFLNAFKGIYTAITTQPNLRIHFIIATLVLLTSVYLELSLIHILILILTISLVIVAEMINSALEFLSDAVTLEQNEYIKHAKDISAGAVLLSAIFAILIGIIIFLPEIIKIL